MDMMATDLVWSYSVFAFKDVEAVHIKPEHRPKVDRLKDSIRKHGILDALVFETEGPRCEKWNVPFWLSDGHHRLRAATELGLATVPVRYIKQWNKE